MTTSLGWEGNRIGLPTNGLNGLRQGNEHPAYTSGLWPSFTFTSIDRMSAWASRSISSLPAMLSRLVTKKRDATIRAPQPTLNSCGSQSSQHTSVVNPAWCECARWTIVNRIWYTVSATKPAAAADAAAAATPLTLNSLDARHASYSTLAWRTLRSQWMIIFYSSSATRRPTATNPRGAALKIWWVLCANRKRQETITFDLACLSVCPSVSVHMC